MTLKEIVKQNSLNQADGIAATATQLGLGYTTVYRILKSGKASRTVLALLKAKKITLESGGL